MKRFLAFIFVLLSVSAPVSGQQRRPASPQVAPNTLYAISDREVRIPPALPTIGAAGTSYIDPYFGTRIHRLTDANTDTATANKSYATMSAADHPGISAKGKNLIIKALDSSVIPFLVTRLGDQLSFARYASTVNSPGNGGRIIQLNGSTDPAFDPVEDNWLWGVDARSGADQHTVCRYDLVADTYTNFYDLDNTGFSLPSTPDDMNHHGPYVGYTSISDPAPTRKLCVLYGGPSGDRHFLVSVFDPKDPAGTLRTLDTRNVTVGSTSATMAPVSTTAFDATGPGTISVTNGSAVVTGSSTLFSSSHDGFGSFAPDARKIVIGGVPYTVSSVGSATQLTLSTNYAGSTNGSLAYQIRGSYLHGANISRKGDNVLITKSYITTADIYVIVIWNTVTDTITKVTSNFTGHITVGFNTFLNQAGNADPIYYLKRPFSDPNNPAVQTAIVSPERCTSGCNFSVADHLTHNAANDLYDALAHTATYRYPSCSYCDDAEDTGGIRAYRPWDNEGIAMRTDAPSAVQYRLFHHRSLISPYTVTTISDGGDGITSGATSFTVADGSKFNVGQNYLKIGNETLNCSRSGNTFSSCTRGFNSTTAATHAEGATVRFLSSVYFYYSPRFQVSPDGSFGIFTSNMEYTLGTTHNGETGGMARFDVFAVEIPTTPDFTPPTLASVTSSSITNTTAAVGGNVSVENGDFKVEYSTDLSYGSSAVDHLLATGSRTKTLTGLSAGTLYNWRASTRDRAGNRSSYQTGSFTTTGGGGGEAAITWTGLVNTSVQNTDELAKTSGADETENAYARSTETIASGDGYTLITVAAGGYPDSPDATYGLDQSSSTNAFANIDFGLKLGSNICEVRQNNVYVTDFSITAGDILKLAIESGNVKIYKNGSLQHTITGPSISYPLYGIATIFKSGKFIKTARIHDN